MTFCEIIFHDILIKMNSCIDNCLSTKGYTLVQQILTSLESSNEMQFLAISLNTSIICIKCNRLKIKENNTSREMFLCVPKINKTHHYHCESNPFSFLFSSYISFFIVCNDVLRLLCMPFWLVNNNHALSCL